MRDYELKIDNAVIYVLGDLKFKNSAKELHYEMLEVMLKKDGQDGEVNKKQLKENISKFESRINNLNDKYFDGEIDTLMFKRTIARYQSDLEKKKSELRSKNRKVPQFKQISSSKLNFISNPLKYYQSIDTAAKQNLLRIFFPENIKFS